MKTKKTLEERVIAYATKRDLAQEWAIKAIKENVKYFEGYSPAKAYEACITVA